MGHNRRPWVMRARLIFSSGSSVPDFLAVSLDTRGDRGSQGCAPDPTPLDRPYKPVGERVGLTPLPTSPSRSRTSAIAALLLLRRSSALVPCCRRLACSFLSALCTLRRRRTLSLPLVH